MPEQVVAEPVQAAARVHGDRQLRHAGVEGLGLVQRVGERVHRPGVVGLELQRRLRGANRFGQPTGLLEREGVQAEHERRAGIVAAKRVRQRQQIREPAEPEVDVIEPLEDHRIARPPGQVLAHQPLRLRHLPRRPRRQRRHVRGLALARAHDRGPRGFRRRLRLGEPLLEEETHRGARVREGEAGIALRRRAEQRQRVGLPRLQRAHRAVVECLRLAIGRGHGQPVRVVRHSAHPIRLGAPKWPPSPPTLGAPRRSRGAPRTRPTETASRAARPTPAAARTVPRRSPRGRPAR